ncbi:MAG: TVP38/TMEM64 family protein [Mogibacterium sp.]|nr:TVP38/TMEM64 family protein [Mogibacterium sp.]
MEDKAVNTPKNKYRDNYPEGGKHAAPEEKSGSWKGRIVLLILAVLCIAAYFGIPSVHEWVNNVVAMFKSGDFDQMHDFIAKYGKWAMAISALLMIFQSLAAPLPAFFITLTNANLFGWWQGCILSWASSMAGAALCFWIARILGRDVVEKICSRGALASIEEFFEKYGKRCILIARLLPFISFDIVSYAAGLTSMGFWGFFVATGIGQLPACIVYSYVGGMLTGGAKKLFIGLLCLFSLAILVALIRQVYSASEKKKQAAAEAAGEVYFKEPSNPARLFSKLYDSAFWGMIIGLVWSGVPTYGAKVNAGWVLLGGWLLTFAIVLCIRKLKCGPIFSAVNVLVCLGIIGYLCGFGSALMRKPAGILRMGLGLRTVPLDTFNIAFVCFLVIGYVIVLLLWKRQKGVDARAKAEYEQLKAAKAAEKMN